MAGATIFAIAIFVWYRNGIGGGDAGLMAVIAILLSPAGVPLFNVHMRPGPLARPNKIAAQSRIK